MKQVFALLVLATLMLAGCKQNTPSQPTPPQNNNFGPPTVCKPPLRNHAAITEDHYMVLGSYQGRGLNTPALSHTFAVFCRFDGERMVEHRTISWMPQSLDVRVLRRDPEPGVNLTYKQTVDLGMRYSNTIFFRGPYKIEPELYRRACEQATELESGRILYKAGDSSTRPKAVNCIHAVADIDREFGYLKTGATWGSSATSVVEKHLFRWVIQDKKDHSWVIQKIQSEAGK